MKVFTTVVWMTPWPKPASCWLSSTLRRMKKTHTTPKTCLCTHAGTLTGAACYDDVNCAPLRKFLSFSLSFSKYYINSTYFCLIPPAKRHVFSQKHPKNSLVYDLNLWLVLLNTCLRHTFRNPNTRTSCSKHCQV